MTLSACHHRCHDCGADSGASAAYTSPPPPVYSTGPKVGDIKPVEAPPPIAVKPVDTKPKVVETKPEITKPEGTKVVGTVPVAVKVETVLLRKIVRIKAGAAMPWKDKDGNEWLADGGFSEGAMVDLGKVKIEGTNNPELYTSEHSNMEKFSWPLPNGKYTLKLHFVENPEDVKKVGERVFSIDALGEKIKSLDILKEAGGFNKALVKTLHVTVTGAKLEISFKAEQKEPLINGIEIIPE